ncbi:MAG TPA: 50S ribosomal protein L4 [Candidatus Paceibacterota bacterium]
MAKKTTKASKAENIEVKVYNQEGKSVNTLALPAEIFGLSWNADLVHQVVTSMQSSARQPVAHTKTRGEVRGGGKKPWKQKGTGRARHGSTRSPIWVGGGVAHGPRNDKDYTRKINKKMKAKALYTILSGKLRDGEMIILDSFALAESKTKQAKSVLSKLGTISGFEKLPVRRNNAALIAVPKLDENTKRGFQNMGNLEVMEVRNINPVALLKYKYVVLASPEESIKTLTSKMN